MIIFRLVAWRFAAPLRRSVAGFRNFLLVGDGPEVAEIARTLEANETRGMRLFGFVRVRTGPAEALPAGLTRSYPAVTLPELPELLRRQVIDEVIFAVGQGGPGKARRHFSRLRRRGGQDARAAQLLPPSHLQSLSGTPGLKAPADFFRHARRRVPVAQTGPRFHHGARRAGGAFPASSDSGGAGQTHFARAHLLLPNALRPGRAEIYALQIPLDAGGRRPASRRARGLERSGRSGVQDQE